MCFSPIDLKEPLKKKYLSELLNWGQNVKNICLINLYKKIYSARRHKQWLIIIMTYRQEKCKHISCVDFQVQKESTEKSLLWPKDSYDLDIQETQNGYLFATK